jgi:hypothetical protein
VEHGFSGVDHGGEATFDVLHAAAAQASVGFAGIERCRHSVDSACRGAHRTSAATALPAIDHADDIRSSAQRVADLDVHGDRPQAHGDAR